VGIGDLLRSVLSRPDNIAAAFIYGSYAKDLEHSDSDIDILVIGGISSKELQSIFSDIKIDAIKIGMLASAEIITTVFDNLPQNIPIILDPVMVSTSGDTRSRIQRACQTPTSPRRTRSRACRRSGSA